MSKMKSTIKVDKDYSITITKPERCPYCDDGMDAKVLNHFPLNTNCGITMYVTLQCPICGNVFVCSYFCGNYLDMIRSQFPFNYSEILGGGISEHFSKEINEVSPSFVKIYNQAYLAEQKGLHEIDGMGYRKAFEFLIKDFAISINPEENEQIINMTLNQCISYLFSESEKKIFERTGWIGNDQTHYEKKHDTFKLEDLKKMIDICIAKIEMSIREKKYLEEFEKSE